MFNIYRAYLIYALLTVSFCFGNSLYAEKEDKDKNKKTEQSTESNTNNNDKNEQPSKDNTPTSTTDTKDIRIVDGKLWIDGQEVKDPQVIAKYMGTNKSISLQSSNNGDASGDLDGLIGLNLLDFKIQGDCEKDLSANSQGCDIKMIDGILYKDGVVVPESQWDEVLRINTTMGDLLDLTPKSFEEKDGGFLSEQEVGKLIEDQWRVRAVKNNFNAQAGLSLDDAVWNMMDGELTENQLNNLARQYEVSLSDVENHVRALEAANHINTTADAVGATQIADPHAWVNHTLESVREAETAKEVAVGISANTYSKTTDIVPVNPAILAEGKKILLSDVYGEDIPAFNHYHGAWDTQKIHNYKYDLSQMKDTVEFFLSHGLGDDFIMPTMGYVTSNFGPRRRRYHNGIDLKLENGDPVQSMFEGKVRIAQYSRSYGYVVVVRHFNGLETLYAHLSKLKVKSGDNVAAGGIVGLGGSTGRSTGNHLHFEVRYKGHPIDPNELIDFNAKTLKHHTFTVDRSYFTSTDPYESAHADKDVDDDGVVSASSAKYYKIRKGDTLGKIAQRYGTSISRICKLNGISTRTTLNVGRSLRLN
ncbi:MAG: M23 family metallopeptidase [Chitinophagales bacterium]